MFDVNRQIGRTCSQSGVVAQRTRLVGATGRRYDARRRIDARPGEAVRRCLKTLTRCPGDDPAVWRRTGMKLTCLPDKLNEGLAAVGRVVAPKSPLPVLGNVLLQTDGGQLKLAATNLELTVICWVGAKVEEEGAITLPARLLADYVGLLSAGEPLNFELKAKKANLSCGRFEANISGIDAEEFPAIPSVSGGISLKIPAPRLKEAIGQVVFAAAPDDSRPVLAGVLMT